MYRLRGILSVTYGLHGFRRLRTRHTFCPAPQAVSLAAICFACFFGADSAHRAHRLARGSSDVRLALP